MRVEEQDNPSAVQEPERKHHRRGSRRRWWIAVAAVLIAAVLLVSGILPRVRARSTLRKETAELAVPTVAVVKPKPSAPAQEIVLPASVQPYINSPIFARTNGYLKKWYVDIGAHVRKGQLLAEIETPEVDQQLRQSRANLATAEANLNLSKITADRYEGLLKSDSVAKQDADNAVGTYNANRAIVQAQQANVRQLEELQSFEKIYAPFDGVITNRNTDIGALITAGSNGGPSTELFQIAQPNKLRVYVNVPEAYSLGAKPGLPAELTLAEYPGRAFPGTLVRTAEAIDPSTRTLLVEISVNNPTGSLFSGAYAEVHMKLPGAPSSFILSVDTLLFRSEGLRVATITDGKHAQLRQITIGHDYGSEVEVIAGLTGNELVIANPPDAIVDGQEVRIAQPSQPTQQQQGGATQ
jgi:RND family efflux transporter MFP subunit